MLNLGLKNNIGYGNNIKSISGALINTVTFFQDIVQC